MACIRDKALGGRISFESPSSIGTSICAELSLAEHASSPAG